MGKLATLYSKVRLHTIGNRGGCSLGPLSTTTTKLSEQISHNWEFKSSKTPTHWLGWDSFLPPKHPSNKIEPQSLKKIAKNCFKEIHPHNMVEFDRILSNYTWKLGPLKRASNVRGRWVRCSLSSKCKITFESVFTHNWHHGSWVVIRAHFQPLLVQIWVSRSFMIEHLSPPKHMHNGPEGSFLATSIIPIRQDWPSTTQESYKK